MNFLRSLILTAIFLASSLSFGLVLQPSNIDSVKLNKGQVFNIKGNRVSATQLSLVSKGGTPLSSMNYGYIDIGGTTRKVSSPKTLTLASNACSAKWGTSGTILLYVYAGSTSGGVVYLCASDVPNQTVVSAASAGAAGYMNCSTALTAADSVRMLGSVSTNCTGPVIANSYSEVAVGLNGLGYVPVKNYGTVSSTTSSTTLVFTVNGIQIGDYCLAQPTALGTGPNYIKSVSTATANQLNVVVDTTQSGGTTTINYICY